MNVSDGKINVQDLATEDLLALDIRESLKWESPVNRPSSL